MDAIEHQEYIKAARALGLGDITMHRRKLAKEPLSKEDWAEVLQSHPCIPVSSSNNYRTGASQKGSGRMKLPDYDSCECGNYRHRHDENTGECIMPDDSDRCRTVCYEFKLGKVATEMPPTPHHVLDIEHVRTMWQSGEDWIQSKASNG